ncbi:hypothetical protein HPB52_018970 [Rhipicephalus sanguineus]|uniref:Tick transposon n=1 Tax=Rhipicephalus sanguineus TaxID=34632 RepID=A0A9D4YQL2_RHISA|nr:hypothetical protein HPB52_018970 [Rhipicephalus sanguineus]
MATLTEALWAQTLHQALQTNAVKRKTSCPKRRFAVIGEVGVPEVADVLNKGPKFSHEPRIEGHELLALNRQIARKVSEKNHERCLLDGVDALMKTRGRLTSRGTKDGLGKLVAFFQQNQRRLLLSDKQGGFVVIAQNEYHRRAKQALTKNFMPVSSGETRVKGKAAALCKDLKLNRIASAIVDAKLQGKVASILRAAIAGLCKPRVEASTRLSDVHLLTRQRLQNNRLMCPAPMEILSKRAKICHLRKLKKLPRSLSDDEHLGQPEGPNSSSELAKAPSVNASPNSRMPSSQNDAKWPQSRIEMEPTSDGAENRHDSLSTIIVQGWEKSVIWHLTRAVQRARVTHVSAFNFNIAHIPGLRSLTAPSAAMLWPISEPS